MLARPHVGVQLELTGLERVIPGVLANYGPGTDWTVLPVEHVIDTLTKLS